MYAKIYLSAKSFGKVIAKTKLCNFLDMAYMSSLLFSFSFTFRVDS